ncbi:MAG: hypothetical protein ABI743_01315, partial [bacterium]
MRCAALCLSILALVGLSACHSNPTAPPATATSGPVIIPVAAGPEQVAGLWDLTVDPSSMTATLTPVVTRGAQGPQAISYDLDIDQFLKPESLEL